MEEEDEAYDPDQPRQAQFFTPEPPGSPVDRPAKDDEEEEAERRNVEQLARAPVQTVGA